MIHRSSIVESSGEIADDVEIGPYAILRGEVSIGTGGRIAGHAQLVGHVVLGENCRVGPGAVIGTDPQDLSFDPDTGSSVMIGDSNVLREHVTIHRSAVAGGATRVGDGNYLMVGAHLGHDVRVGDHNVIANNCMLGGHVHLGCHAFLGGGSGIHQYVRVGDRTMVPGNASLSMDLPPYLMSTRPNEVAGLNRVSLRRAGFEAAAIAEIRELFSICYRRGFNLTQALDEAGAMEWATAEAVGFLDFFRAESKKGVCARLARRSRA
ncbi:MAG: acyl-ACP--UDP-N-acetylglucosamine O-acyltransferase [Verrucomicrobiales bacterium]